VYAWTVIAPAGSISSRRGSPARKGSAARPATIADWLAIPEEKRAELIRGQIVYHAFPGPKHGWTQRRLGVTLDPYSRSKSRAGHSGGGGTAPGGWWLSQEVDMEIGPLGVRPDLIGWRRDRCPRLPEPDARGVVTEVPDFICEVLSPSTARYDLGEKRQAYFDAGVGHYWLVDPANRTLTVLKRTELGYVVAVTAGAGDTVRAEPFEGAELTVSDLFVDEEGGEEREPPRPAPAATETPSTEAAAPSPAPKRRAASKARPRRSGR